MPQAGAADYFSQNDCDMKSNNKSKATMVAVAITVAATKALATCPAAMHSAKRHAAALSMDSPFTLRKQPYNARP